MSVKIKSRGKRGREFSSIKSIGQVVVFLDDTENFISVDAYSGMGEGYKKREVSEITIKSDCFVWVGTFDELFNKLKK